MLPNTLHVFINLIFIALLYHFNVDNEELQDLLNTSGDRKLKLCEDVKKGVVCQNLEEITVLNVGDIFEILQKGDGIECITVLLIASSSSSCNSMYSM